MDNNITSDEKIRQLKIYLDNLKDLEKINEIFDICKDNGMKPEKENNNNNNINKEVMIKKELDKNSYKYTVFLKLLNKILEEAGKPNIDDIYEFKDISRNDILKNDKVNELFGLEKELFGPKSFKKQGFYWYERKKKENYIFTFLRKACEDLGVELKFLNRKKISKKSNKVVYTNYYFIV